MVDRGNHPPSANTCAPAPVVAVCSGKPASKCARPRPRLQLVLDADGRVVAGETTKGRAEEEEGGGGSADNDASPPAAEEEAAEAERWRRYAART